MKRKVLNTALWICALALLLMSVTGIKGNAVSFLEEGSGSLNMPDVPEMVSIGEPFAMEPACAKADDGEAAPGDALEGTDRDKAPAAVSPATKNDMEDALSGENASRSDMESSAADSAAEVETESFTPQSDEEDTEPNEITDADTDASADGADVSDAIEMETESSALQVDDENKATDEMVGIEDDISLRGNTVCSTEETGETSVDAPHTVNSEKPDVEQGSSATIHQTEVWRNVADEIPPGSIHENAEEEDGKPSAFPLDNAPPYFQVIDVSAKPGEEDVAVNVAVRGNPGILGMTLSVLYDEDVMELTGADNGEAVRSVLTLTKPGKFASQCRFMWDGQDISPKDVADGNILTLYFHVFENVDGGIYPVALYYNAGDVLDNNILPVEMEVENGSVTIITI